MAEPMLLLPRGPEEEAALEAADREASQKRIAKMPLYTFQSEEQLKKVIFWAFFPEYLSLPLFYYLVKAHNMMASHFLQVLFLAGSSYLQLSGFKFVVGRTDLEVEIPLWQRKERRTQQILRSMLAPLKSIMGMPVHFFGLRQWEFDMISLAPNYLQIITTVQAIAAVEDEYRGEPEEVFRIRWQHVAVIGQYVADLGLPNILKLSVCFNMASHLFAFRLTNLSMQAEAANLLFLEKATNSNQPGIHVVRTLAAPLVKVPMLWMKVSLLSLLYDSLASDPAGLRAIIFAILLAFYGLVPILSGWGRITWSIASNLLDKLKICDNSLIFYPFMMMMPLLAFAIGMGIVLLHFAGVFICESHDLTVFHGCTQKLNMTNTSGP